MRIGLISPPFIAVPPLAYGGTELFIANLARTLHEQGHDVTVYANGESRLPCRVKWRYPLSDWPLADPLAAQLKNADHTAWAIHDAAQSVDVLHLNDAVAVPFTPFVDLPTVFTLHHPHDLELSAHYARYPELHYVAVARWLANREALPKMHVVHHGLRLEDYRWAADKDDYVAFLGRMAPCKGAHLAIRAALSAGIRLKIAGEIQPVFREYWEREIAPFVDGRRIEYVGEVDLPRKNELLSRARALLFPIQWHEPFGLVMIEAMACGTPVLAFAGGAVEEVVEDGVNGWICDNVDEMAARLAATEIDPRACREWVAEHFSAERMAEQYVDIYEEVLAGRRPVTKRAS